MENENKLYFDLKGAFNVSFTSWPPAQYPLHYHKRCEAELILDGEGVQTTKNEETPLRKGYLYFVHPLQSHSITSKGITIANFSLEEKYIPKWIIQRLFALNNIRSVELNEEQFETVKSFFSLAKKEVENKEDKYKDVISLLFELIARVFFRNLSKENGENGDDIIHEVIYYLQHNQRFTEKVTLQEISDHVGYSKFYISSKFHKAYGCTIQEFIVLLRVDYAKKLLLETKSSILEIVTASGFPTTSNFYQQFSKYTGMSPLKYRKANKDNDNK